MDDIFIRLNRRTRVRTLYKILEDLGDDDQFRHFMDVVSREENKENNDKINKIFYNLQNKDKKAVLDKCLDMYIAFIKTNKNMVKEMIDIGCITRYIERLLPYENLLIKYAQKNQKELPVIIRRVCQYCGPTYYSNDIPYKLDLIRKDPMKVFRIFAKLRKIYRIDVLCNVYASKDYYCYWAFDKYPKFVFDLMHNIAWSYKNHYLLHPNTRNNIHMLKMIYKIDLKKV